MPGMVLEGVVTNVANFGAFVDIGVHQDGLVHISAITNRFIKDPREAVKTGDIVKVKVLEVDAARKRIGLTMRLDDEIASKTDSGKIAPRIDRKMEQRYMGGKPEKPAAVGSMGDLLRKAMTDKVQR
jgi:protein Tex